MTVLRALADLCGKQVFYCKNMANRVSTVQYHCIFALLFARYSLQLDNNSSYRNLINVGILQKRHNMAVLSTSNSDFDFVDRVIKNSLSIFIFVV